MTTVNIAALTQAAKKDQDFTKTSSGGSFERELPVEGIGFLRLREYIELGIHEHGRAPHAKDRPLARFVFELTHKKHQMEFEKDGEKVTAPHVMSVTLPISDNESADYIKIFNLLNWDGTLTHPLEALNRPMMCKINHSESGEGDKKRSYANLWTGTPKDKTWQILPPVKEADPMDDSSVAQDISAAIPQLAKGEESLKVFLWLHADQAQWDTLFIEGTRTVKDAKGNEKEESKNYLQEKIKQAKNYAGSPIEQVLAADGEDMGNLPTSEEAVADSNKATEDALADLGL